MSVAELFGIPQKKEEKKVEEVKPVVEEKKVEKSVKEEVIKKPSNIKQETRLLRL